MILNVQSIAFTLGGIAFILLALGGIGALPVVLDFVGLRSGTERLLALGRWPVLLPAAWPSSIAMARAAERAQWKWVTPGSLVATILWIAASMLFLVVGLQLRQLQRNLWFAWSRNRLHDVDLAVLDRHPGRGRDQRRDRAPNGNGHH